MQEHQKGEENYNVSYFSFLFIALRNYFQGFSKQTMIMENL